MVIAAVACKLSLCWACDLSLNLTFRLRFHVLSLLRMPRFMLRYMRDGHRDMNIVALDNAVCQQGL